MVACTEITPKYPQTAARKRAKPGMKQTSADSAQTSFAVAGANATEEEIGRELELLQRLFR